MKPGISGRPAFSLVACRPLVMFKSSSTVARFWITSYDLELGDNKCSTLHLVNYLGGKRPTSSRCAHGDCRTKISRSWVCLDMEHSNINFNGDVLYVTVNCLRTPEQHLTSLADHRFQILWYCVNSTDSTDNRRPGQPNNPDARAQHQNSPTTALSLLAEGPELWLPKGRPPADTSDGLGNSLVIPCDPNEK